MMQSSNQRSQAAPQGPSGRDESNNVPKAIDKSSDDAVNINPYPPIQLSAYQEQMLDEMRKIHVARRLWIPNGKMPFS